jgi:hypothetical protein
MDESLPHNWRSMSDKPTPTSAQLLAAAEHGSGAGETLASRAAVSDAAFAITLGVLVASFLLAVEFIFPSGNLVLIFASVVAYGLGVLCVVLWNQRRRRATRRGWAKRYAVGFTMTMSLYAVGVALSVADEPSSLVFWLVYAAITAAPLAIAALWRERA